MHLGQASGLYRWIGRVVSPSLDDAQGSCRAEADADVHSGLEGGNKVVLRQNVWKALVGDSAGYQLPHLVGDSEAGMISPRVCEATAPQ